MTGIDVACVPSSEVGGEWTCSVRVRDDRGATEHEVTVTEVDVPESLADPGDDVDLDDIERLVRETFVFLLERESKESILRRFDLGVVERYFSEYRIEIARRLSR